MTPAVTPLRKLRHRLEAARAVGHAEVDSSPSPRVCGALVEPELLEIRGDLGGRGFRRADELDPGARHLADGRLEERVVRTTQDHGVDPREQERFEVAARNLQRHGIVLPSLFDQRHKEGAGLALDLELWTKPRERSWIGARADRRLGGEDPDASRAESRRLTGTGFDHPPDRQRRLDFFERQGGRGVASDHDRLDTAAGEKGQIALRVADHGLGGLGAVGQPCGVAEIENGLLG